MWVHILKNKSQVFEDFVEQKALVENSTGQKLKTLYTDNGGEYRSAEFTVYLIKEETCHEFTVPMTPQQNGVAEQTNRTLVEVVRSMLSDAKLPKKFWAEALSTSVYLHNCKEGHHLRPGQRSNLMLVTSRLLDICVMHM